jgi:VanZ family protein
LVKKLLAQLWAPLVWTVVMETLYCLPGSSLPNPESFHIPSLDKLVHVFLFATFVSLWCYYFYRKEKSPQSLKIIFFAIYLFAAFNGVLIEFLQRDFIPGRSFDTVDIIADMTGASLAYGVCNIKLLKTSV